MGSFPSRRISLLFLATTLLAIPTLADEPTTPAQLQSAFEQIATTAAPGVVAISASTTVDNTPAVARQPEMNPETLQHFLAKTTRMVGTGFFISADGYLLTNDHVIDDAAQLWVTTDDRHVYPALVVGSDPRSDLAVLKIPAAHCAVIPWAAPAAVDALHRGQWSIALGNPFGLCTEGEMSLSVGVVSAVHRSLQRLSEKENRSYYELIQTTAPINPGNSGGPLLDIDGHVVGINTAVIMPAPGVNGIGFAMPLNQRALDVVSCLKRGDEVVYAYLGIGTETATEADRDRAGLDAALGVAVARIYPGSPADGILHEGDLVTHINDVPVADSNAFTRLIGSAGVEQPARLTVCRNGRIGTVAIQLRKRDQPIEPVTRDSQRLHWAGLLLGNAPEPGTPTGLSAGLMVLAIDPASPLAKQGLHEGSFIQSVAGQSVSSLVDLQNVIEQTPIDRCDINTAPAEATASISLDR